jgi:hypothetical protein
MFVKAPRSGACVKKGGENPVNLASGFELLAQPLLEPRRL